MRNTVLLFSALIGVFYFTNCYNAAQSKSIAAQQARADKAAADLARQQQDKIAEDLAKQEREKAAEDLARQERDRVAAEEARERERVAEERAERRRIKRNIETVLRQDAEAPVGAESVAEIVTRMREIDLSGCPEDFRLAYVNHIHAWESMREVERNAIAFRKAANSDGVLVEAFIRGLLGDPLGEANQIEAAQTQLQRDYRAAHSEIKETFNRVEDIAVQNAAKLPR